MAAVVGADADDDADDGDAKRVRAVRPLIKPVPDHPTHPQGHPPLLNVAVRTTPLALYDHSWDPWEAPG